MTLEERVIYLEKVVDELKYLAACQGWKWYHLPNPMEDKLKPESE